MVIQTFQIYQIPFGITILSQKYLKPYQYMSNAK